MTEFPDSFSYCDYVSKPTSNPIHKKYHDEEYGFPQSKDSVLFERLTHEIFQAGLSWEIILKKKEAFAQAFHGFDVPTVAAFGPEEIEILMRNAGIIRNRRKIDATIYNANQVLQLISEYGSFKAWIDSNHPHNIEDWIKIFKQKFKFMGKEVVTTFLQSLGYLPLAHKDSCATYSQILLLSPPWHLAKDFFELK